MLPLLQHLGVMAFGRVRPTARRYTRMIVGGAVVAVLALTTYVALLVSLGLYLSGEVGPVYAALIIAGVTALCALIVIAVIKAMNSRAARKMEAQRRAARSKLPDPMTLQLLATVPGLLRGRSLLGTAAVAALVFGFAKMQGAGRDPRNGDD